MSDVAIYESASGQIAVTVEHDSVWLRQEQLAELFGRDRTVIGRHIRNVFAEHLCPNMVDRPTLTVPRGPFVKVDYPSQILAVLRS